MRFHVPVGLTIVGASTYIFAAALIFASYNAKAADFDCETLKSNAEIRACLNAYAKSQLEKNSPADRLFSERLDRMLKKYRLIGAQIKTESLADSFSIYVEESPQLKNGNSSALCFDFEKGHRTQGHKARLIENIKRQVDEVAKFLAVIHASSFGHQVSLLFPIKEVSICSAEQLKDRALSFEQRSLHVGLASAPTESHKLIDSWNSGNPIRSTELSWYNQVPILGGFMRKFLNRDNPELILRDKIAENWIFLNPTGNLRTTALYTLSEAIFAIKTGLEKDHQGQGSAQSSENLHSIDESRMYSAMFETIRGPGFTKEDMDRLERIRHDPAAIAGLYNLWRQKIYSPQNILTVIENAIGDQARKSQNLHLTLRKINAGISIANDKNIVVRLEQLMESSIPVSKFNESAVQERSGLEVTRTTTKKDRQGVETTVTTTLKSDNAQDLSLNADEVNSAISIHLIDNVVISLQMPNISPQTYRRVSFYQALNEFLSESEIPSPK